MGQIGREFALAGFAVLAGLSFGSAVASIWGFATGVSSKALEWFDLTTAFGGAILWLLLFIAWRRRIDTWAMIVTVAAFVGCAGLTGIGGIVEGQFV